jgi:pimeloyl-ACP methyl ester carboxylesterase
MLEALRHSNHDLGLDVQQARRVFDTLPDGPARGAFTRTLRSVVDWRGQVVTMLDRSYLAENVPVLLIWGTRDGVIPVHHGHEAVSAMPGSRLVLFEGAGHFPHHADPVRFVAELQGFIAETEPVRSTPARRRQLLLRGARRPGADPVEPIALT